MKVMVLALGLTAVVAAVIGLSLALSPSGAQAQGQTRPAAPANVRATNGAEPGQAVVMWDAVADAAYYRIGWVAFQDIATVQDAGRPWLDAFAFTDVTNYGQTSHTLTGLVPGIEYAFITGSVSSRFGIAQWSEWAYLTLAEAPATACPTTGGEPAAPQAPSPTGTRTPAATPAATPAPTATPVSTPTPAATPRPTPTGTGKGDRDYDTDKDGLIEVSNLAQLAAIRADLNGDGVSPAPAYAAAFPDAMPGMGCPDAGCTGYELVANLDFDTNGNGEADAGDAYWNDGAGWIPIGNSAHSFTADFDGNNHTIANLYINRSKDYAGLFGYAVGNSVKQVGIVSATVYGGHGVGGLVGYSSGSTISGSYATGGVSGWNYVGGLVGYSLWDTISGSYATSSVSGDNYAGGLVGYSTQTTVSGSYATGNVSSGASFVGGMVGYSRGRTISGSYATGSVSGNDYTGGLVGEHHGIISASYATGDVSGESNVGGLVGEHHGTISASYAMGDVSGESSVGGLVGEHLVSLDHGTISASYAIGDVSGSGDDIGGLVGKSGGGSGTTITTSYAAGRVSTSGDTFHIGGLVGYDEGGEITASYWDTQTTGQAGSYGGVGKSTAELQSPTTNSGIYADWDARVWDFGNSRQYPVLKYQGMDVAAQRR